MINTLAIPSQTITNDYVVYLLADTHWKIKDSKYNIELELLFENAHFFSIQELNGNYIFNH